MKSSEIRWQGRAEVRGELVILNWKPAELGCLFSVCDVVTRRKAIVSSCILWTGGQTHIYKTQVNTGGFALSSITELLGCICGND
jgi:hypothetical protein